MPKSERRQRTAMVSVRFTSDELAAVQAAAGGGTVSGYIRDLALGRFPRPRLAVGDSGRMGEPRALLSSLPPLSRSFGCAHLSASGVGLTEVSCGACGPIPMVA